MVGEHRDEEVADGRRRRAERSRTAVVDAMLSLYDDGVLQPSAAEIAERAGVSERSVFRHFADLESVAAEAVDRQFARVAPFFAPPSPDGGLHQRLAALVDQRCRLYGRMHDFVVVTATVAIRSPTVASFLAKRQAMLRKQVADQFAPELDGLDARDRRLLLAALEQATSLEALAYLRTAAGVGPRDLRIVLSTTIEALLGQGADLPRSTP